MLPECYIFNGATPTATFACRGGALMNKRVFLLKYALPAGLILATGAVALRIMLGGWIPFFATSTPPTGPLSPEQEKIAASLLDPSVTARRSRR